MYVRQYTNLGSLMSIDGYERPIRLPDPPRESEIINNGLPIEQQKFKREELPTDDEFLGWDRKRQEAFARDQWHKRINGQWIRIKGELFFFTGSFWFYLNYWYEDNGMLPDFRMEGLEFFLVLDDIERSSVDIGVFDIKGRRQGDTGKSLSYGYELCTRYRASQFGMQHVNEEGAFGNYQRLMSAHALIRPWFKPNQSSLSAEPKDGLVFRFKTTGSTRSEAESAGIRHLNSRITYKPTKAGAYDGQRLRFYHLDEPGKMKPSDMDIVECWAVVRETLTLNVGQIVVGKAAFTTTVEDIASGSTVAKCKELWSQSDPTNTDAYGRTLSGLVRYFRSYLCSAPIDEYGFHKKSEAASYRAERIRQYIESGDFHGLAAFKRKYPETIDEALSIPPSDCIFYPALLDVQSAQIDEWKAHLKIDPRHEASNIPLPVRGNLEWTNGIMSDVKFVPTPNGKFNVSQFPIRPNAREVISGISNPGNTFAYSMGVDPIDHVKGRHTKSDFAMSIFRKFDPMYEPFLQYMDTEHGKEVFNKHMMMTNRFVLEYRNRFMNPNDSYMDMLKAMVWYGVSALIERDKPGAIHFATQNGAAKYLKYKNHFWGGAKRETTPGLKQTQQSTSIFVEHLKTYVSSYHQLLTLPGIIADLRQCNGDNMNDCDLVVASGLALADANLSEITSSKNSAFTEELW